MFLIIFGTKISGQKLRLYEIRTKNTIQYIL